MGLRWTDTIDIAIELTEAHPDVDPQWIRFTDLHAWVCALPDFMMIQISRQKVCLKPFKWLGWMKFVKNLSEITELLQIQADYWRLHRYNAANFLVYT
jgi:hypothetical protein